MSIILQGVYLALIPDFTNEDCSKQYFDFFGQYIRGIHVPIQMAWVAVTVNGINL